MSKAEHSRELLHGAAYGFSAGVELPLVVPGLAGATRRHRSRAFRFLGRCGRLRSCRGRRRRGRLAIRWPSRRARIAQFGLCAAFGFLPLNASPPCLAQNTAIKQTTIQIEAVMMVIFVNTSPALAPKALEPPMPPSAPARPPPRPRCTRTSRIKKIARNEIDQAGNVGRHVDGVRLHIGIVGRDVPPTGDPEPADNDGHQHRPGRQQAPPDELAPALAIRPEQPGMWRRHGRTGPFPPGLRPCAEPSRTASAASFSAGLSHGAAPAPRPCRHGSGSTADWP